MLFHVPFTSKLCSTKSTLIKCQLFLCFLRPCFPNLKIPQWCNIQIVCLFIFLFQFCILIAPEKPAISCEVEVWRSMWGLMVSLWIARQLLSKNQQQRGRREEQLTDKSGWARFLIKSKYEIQKTLTNYLWEDMNLFVIGDAKEKQSGQGQLTFVDKETQCV